MSGREISHLAISTIVLSIAFGIALGGGTRAFDDMSNLLDYVRISFIAVALGFTFHEMSHRYMARRYGFSAEYYMSPAGLGIALALSLTGWIFAAPGAVRIYKGPSYAATADDSQKTLGRISLAGPVANICLAVIFLLIGFAAVFARVDSPFWKLALFGTEINAWLAFFNMLPFGPLDGRDVFKWNKAVWAAVITLSLALYLLVIL